MSGAMIPPAAQTPRGTTILIVEDDKEIGNFLQTLIEEETPYQPVVISDSRLALETAQQLHPNLLLQIGRASCRERV